ncbi:MAG: C_GCAxxG_C_C family protein [Firmicutes bacterium]|nr:C_GCAxxG_C_C family protein [Bacillota bacterium]
MHEKAFEYYRKGEGCSRSILLAAMDKYGNFDDSVLKCATAITGGFGIGSFCSALVAGIMVIGLFFDEYEAEKKRILLMSEFQCRFSSVNCGCIMKNRSECEDVLEFICCWLDRNISENLGRAEA